MTEAEPPKLSRRKLIRESLNFTKNVLVENGELIFGVGLLTAFLSSNSILRRGNYIQKSTKLPSGQETPQYPSIREIIKANQTPTGYVDIVIDALGLVSTAGGAVGSLIKAHETNPPHDPQHKEDIDDKIE